METFIERFEPGQIVFLKSDKARKVPMVVKFFDEKPPPFQVFNDVEIQVRPTVVCLWHNSQAKVETGSFAPEMLFFE